MTELLTAAQMRAIEQAAIESGQVTGLELMERAGRGVVEAVFEEWPELAQTSHRAVVLCGPGNNGGDGFVVARLLKEWGWEVEVFLYGDPEKLPPDARVNYERWCQLGAVEGLLGTEGPKIQSGGAYEDGILVDALFGTGLARPLDQDLRLRTGAILSSIPISFLKTVAIDMPSGLCSDSGRWLVDENGHALHRTYQLAVTFHRARQGHFLANAADVIGRLAVKPLGLDEIRSGFRSARIHAGFQVIAAIFQEKKISSEEEFRRAVLAPASKEPLDPFELGSDGTSLVAGIPFEADKSEAGTRTHKYTHGHALILSGGPGKGGAGRLAARGALRIGAGLVTLGCPPAALTENAAQLNAIMLKPLGSDEDLSLLLDGDTRINALCLGPGFGSGARERQLVAAALAAKRKTVLDADALTLIAGDTALFDALHDGCVLTPHHGEFARLFPDIAEKLNAPATAGPAYSKVDATRKAAKRAGCTVLFKGPDTVIADPSGRCAINSAHYDRAAPWLATAGSGDVLAGFITGLLARGFAPMQAAETAAWLHVEAAHKFGPGLIAEDLPEMLPQVFRDLCV